MWKCFHEIEAEVFTLAVYGSYPHRLFLVASVFEFFQRPVFNGQTNIVEDLSKFLWCVPYVAPCCFQVLTLLFRNRMRSSRYKCIHRLGINFFDLNRIIKSLPPPPVCNVTFLKSEWQYFSGWNRRFVRRHWRAVFRPHSTFEFLQISNLRGIVRRLIV